jgi:hypothetical protein
MPSPGRQVSPAGAARTAYARAAAALLLVSAWMALLFAGFLFGGALHLLLPAAAVLFPWRWLAPPLPPSPPWTAEPPETGSAGPARHGDGEESLP